MSTTATLEPIAAQEMSNLKRNSQPRAPRSASLPKLDRIVLTGFMGSGKSTVGKRLAAELGWDFHDLDAEIERRAGRSVAQIFAAEGEQAFRHLESAALAHLLGLNQVVVALGGGAPEVLGNRLLLEQTPRTAVVHLDAPLDILLDRCRRDTATERPLLGEAQQRFRARRPLYERIAAHTVQTAGLDADAVVNAVRQSVRC